MNQETVLITEIGKALVPACYEEALAKQTISCMVACHNSQCTIREQCGFYERFINLSEERTRYEYRLALDGRL